MNKAKTVDEYIKLCPQEQQTKLRELRKIIQTVAPEAEEKISYGMPYYGYKGRLLYFALAKNHIGIYIPPPIIQDHEKELAHYVTTKSAIHIPLDKELPVPLIRKLIKARILHNIKVEKN
jgi:uncharacterized protein YdhG (YjbR/CyaY superfamily)